MPEVGDLGKPCGFCPQCGSQNLVFKVFRHPKEAKLVIVCENNHATDTTYYNIDLVFDEKHTKLDRWLELID